jgi:FkbM family methyltransferase
MSLLSRMCFRALVRKTMDTETIRLGGGYGAWVVPTDVLAADSVVYSAGVGEDASFDLELIRMTGCEVWAFDPTPRAAAFAETIKEPRFHFAPIGIWSEDSRQQFFAPKDASHVSHSIDNLQSSEISFEAECRSIPSLMHEFGHPAIDLLKLDIEGAEYEVLESIRDVRPRVLCVEFHPSRPTRQIARFVRELPYDVVAVDDWDVTLLARSRT